MSLINKILREPSYKAGNPNVFSGRISLSPHRPSILFVEDDEQLIDLYEYYFSTFYTVSVAHTIEEALEVVHSTKIDIIVADFHLHDETVVKMLKVMEGDNELAIIPTIIYTGEANPTLHREALLSGAETVLMKPVSIVELKKSIDWMLAKTAKQRAGLFRYFAKSVDKLMEKKLPKTIDHFGLTLTEGFSGLGGGDVIVHYETDDYHRIILADIMGHGLSATASAVSFSTMLHCFQSQVCPTSSPSDFLNILSKVMNRDDALGQIMATVCVIDLTKTGTLRYALAGHPLPMLMREKNIIPFEGGGPFLGLLPEDVYHTSEKDLQSGDRILLYTDGIDPYGLTSSGKLPEWFLKNLQDHADFSAEQAMFALTRDVKEKVSSMPADDWTMLMINTGFKA